MAVLIRNNAASRLASSLTNVATSFAVTTGEGAKFPSPSGGDWFPVTVLKGDGSLEIMRCTARSGDTLTVTRAQESTTGLAFSAGDRVELRITAAAMAEFMQVAGGSFSGNINVPSINGGPLSGMRNKVINGNFPINQLGVSGSVVLAAGVYGHDGWKAGASGCTYTFATSGGITTLTITAGSLQSTLEGVNLQSGTHTLSWSGTAQGKIGGGSYSASGVTGAVTGGSNITIEFNTGTLSLVQLEPGSIATPFEHRSFGLELALCQRYYCTSSNTNDSSGWFGTTTSGHTYRSYARFPVTMRTTPTVVVTHIAGGGFPTSGTVVAGLNGYSEERVASASGNNAWSTTYTASARL